MKTKPLLTLLSLTLVNFVFSQRDVVASGGQASGSGGSVSYSIGQIDYITSIGSGGTITQGVQQPYEIFVISGVEEKNISLLASAYPNPTTDFITLDVSNPDIKNTSYILYDVNGKTMKEGNVTLKSTSIEINDLPASVYFLEVKINNEKVKQFKIVKNK